MCLYYSKGSTKNVASKLKSKPGVFYKKLRFLYSKELVCVNTPYRYVPVVLENGYLVSNRNKTEIGMREINYGLNIGIHVYRRNSKYYKGNDAFVIPVKGHGSNFVAASAREAVFTKIRINKEVLIRHAVNAFKEFKQDLEKKGTKLNNQRIILFQVKDKNKSGYVCVKFSKDWSSYKTYLVKS